jgi:hypothetical protein
VREPQIVEREAAIVEVLRGGGPMPAPDIASAVFAVQRPSRSRVMMVTQSLRVLERDRIVRRQPVLTGPRHWELV